MSEIVFAKELYAQLPGLRTILSETTFKDKKGFDEYDHVFTTLKFLSSQLSFKHFNDSKRANLSLRTQIISYYVGVNEYNMDFTDERRNELLTKLNILKSALEREIATYQEE